MASANTTKSSDFTSEERRNISARIRKARTQIGLLQSEAASKMSYSVSHYAKMENGIARFSRRLVEKFADTFGVCGEWLLTGEGEMTQPSAQTSGSGDTVAAEGSPDAQVLRVIDIMRDSAAQEAAQSLMDKLGLLEREAWEAVVRAKLKQLADSRGT
jgi:transcriptional regulator with XRE-family HTH domain